MNYYPFHIGDFTAHTSHLTWEEDIAYRRMLDVYYLREKPLPIDVPAVARLVRMRDSLEAVEAVLTEFFVLQDDGWHQERCDQEIVSMREKQAGSEARDEHEKNRMRRHRERRAEMFAWLRERGVVPAWDVSIKDLQRMCNEHGMTPETRLQREQEEACNAPATAIPTPTPTPTPVNTPSDEGVVPRKRSTPAMTAARPDDVSEPVWQDFQRLRREKRAPLTDTALAGVRREAGKAGVSMETALAYCCEAGWQGFNAGWYADRQGAGGRGVAAQAVETYAQRAARQRMEEVAPMAARKQPSSAFDAAQRFMQGEVIDVAAVPKQLARVV